MAYDNEQNEYPLPADGKKTRASETLLPRYFRTEVNKKFLQATLDQLTQPGVAEKLNGYYGREISKAYNADDNYIGDISTQRQDYQFEPAAIVKDDLDNVTFYKDYNDYLNQIKIFGGNTTNQEVLNAQEYYAWNPNVDFDKFTNLEKKDFLKRDKFVNYYHAISKKTKKQIEQLTDKPIVTLPFWINNKKFYEIKEKNVLREKYKISNEEFLIGSFQRDTEGSDLFSPKLSKGPDQFIEMVKRNIEARENVAVLLTGKRRQYVLNEIEKLDIKYYYYEMTSFEQLNELYNVLDLYIVASRVEGGTQSIFECAITKTPIISTDVGIASELLAPESIFDFNRDTIPRPNVDQAFKEVKKYVTPDWFNAYIKMFESLLWK